MSTGKLIPPLGTPLNKSISIVNGLTNFYPFNEGGGNIANNIVGRGLFNGSLINGATWKASAFGKVLLLDGVNDYVETNYIMPASSYSFGGWGNTNVAAVTNRMMGNSDDIAGDKGADIIVGYSLTTNIYSVRRNDATGARDINAVAVSSGTPTGWNHIISTYNTSSGGVLYFNGKIIGTNATLGFNNTLTFRIGRVGGSGSNFFNGLICLVGIWSRALTAVEVKRLYSEPNCMFQSARPLKIAV